MATNCRLFRVKCSVEGRPSISKFHHFKNSLTSSINFKLQPVWSEIQQLPIRIDASKNKIKEASIELLDGLVHSVFEFVDQTRLPSQSNFAPVEELGEGVDVGNGVEGRIPDDFPEGVYIRNGPNPLFGGFKSTESMFGRSSQVWVEGEGMLHALYLKKKKDSSHDGNEGGGCWTVCYNNRHVETETFKFEKGSRKPSFLPAIEGDSPAILAAYLLNLMRFGKANKVISNTNIFEHAGKFYSVAESDLPQEIDINTLKRLRTWDINGAWNRPFTSHPKKAPGSGELVMMGVDANKPFFELGIISADGSRLVHKADLKFERCSLCHDIGVTQRYNVILDFPLTIDINRLLNGGPLIKHDRMAYARIGVMPRYGDAHSVKWFEVEASSVFHIINCFEDGDEVIMRACRARGSVIPGPDLGLNKYEWFSKGFKHVSLVKEEENGGNSGQEASFFSRAYEWRLNMKTGEAKERNLTGTEFSMDFPMINDKFTGRKNKYGYTQLVDSEASSIAGMAKYGGLAKLHFQEPDDDGCSAGKKQGVGFTKIEYHKFPPNTFCTGSAFAAKLGGLEEDDGWIITFVHNEHSNLSEVYIIDAKKFSSEPVVKIKLSSRVPYGFHGAFFHATDQLITQKPE